VICSHWSVPDKETAQLVTDFMAQVTSELADGRPADYANALKNAKLKLRARNASAKMWAPLVLVGPPTNAESAPRDGEIATRD
jgi:CHAT domain-containing protein